MATLPENFEQIMVDFTEEILQALELGSVSKEQQEVLRGLIMQRINSRIITTIVQNMPDAILKEFIAKTDKGPLPSDEEERFFADTIDTIPDFIPKLVKALDELRLELLYDAADLRALSDVSLKQK